MKLVASDNAASAAAAVAADTIADLRSKFATANAAKAEAEAANMKSAHIIKGLTDEKLNSQGGSMKKSSLPRSGTFAR